MRRRSLMAVAIPVMWWSVCVPRAAFSQPLTAAGQTGLGELRIEGQSIESLTLVHKTPLSGGESGFAGQQFVRPGKSLSLPAGRYCVSQVALENGYRVTGRFSPGPSMA